ncbi:MAG: hypothetical protein OEX19_16005 [Gammaproteobacteria bacterium]|nr:hypothetical protein [Gammaproteobacteria bacterium]
MAVSNTWEERGLYREFLGVIDGEEIWGANLALHGDERFDQIKYVLNDFTHIDGFEIEDVDVDAIVVMDKTASISKPTLHIAIVVGLVPFRDLAIKYQQKMQGSTYVCEIFDNIKDARAWID